jgi:copper chaperone CopZ
VSGSVQTGSGAVATEQFSFPVEGMTCSNCAGRVEKALRGVPGVIEANVNLAIERADVRARSGSTDLQALSAAVSAAGYRARIARASQTADRAERSHVEHERVQSQLRREFLVHDGRGNVRGAAAGADGQHEPRPALASAAVAGAAAGNAGAVRDRRPLLPLGWQGRPARSRQHGPAGRPGHERRLRATASTCCSRTLGQRQRHQLYFEASAWSSSPWCCWASSWKAAPNAAPPRRSVQLMEPCVRRPRACAAWHGDVEMPIRGAQRRPGRRAPGRAHSSRRPGRRRPQRGRRVADQRREPAGRQGARQRA